MIRTFVLVSVLHINSPLVLWLWKSASSVHFCLSKPFRNYNRFSVGTRKTQESHSVFSLRFWCHSPIQASNFKNNSPGQKFTRPDFTWQKKQLKCYYLLLIRHYKILGSKSFARCLISLVLVLELALLLNIVLPYHCISQSFDLSHATIPVSHLTCPLKPHHCNTALPHRSVIWLAPTTTSVSHLTCPLPPHQSVIWLAHCHHISQSFDLPSTTASLHYHIGQSFDLPLPPHQSVIWLAPTTTSLCPHHP